MTNLLKTLDFWTSVLEDGGNIDTVYLEFAKAFYTVLIPTITTALQAYDIKSDILYWMLFFWRTAEVVLNGAKSEWQEV